MELLVIALVGGALAWIQARSGADDRAGADDAAWRRWEAELQDISRF